MLKQAGGWLLSGLLLVPVMSYAQGSGFYVGGHIGAAGVETNSNIYHSVTINGSTSQDGYVPFGQERDIGLAGGVSVGYNFNEQFGAPVRVELNYTARSESKMSGKKWDYLYDLEGTPFVYLDHAEKVDLQTLMVNLWADIPTGTAFRPYVGGGICAAFLKYKNNTDFRLNSTGEAVGTFTSGSESATNFAWSLGGGVAYDFTPNWTMDLGYRYINAGKISTEVKRDRIFGSGTNNYKTGTKVRSHEVFLGGRYNF